MLVSIYVTLHLASIEQAWKLLIVTGAGTGTVLLLRWFWWRINAWSEVSAMAVGRGRVAVSADRAEVGRRQAARLRVPDARHGRPDDDRVAGGDVDDAGGTGRDTARLLSSGAAARPRLGADRGRGRVAGGVGILGGELLNALLGCVLVYAALFGVGELLLRSAAIGAGLLVVSAAAAYAIARNLTTGRNGRCARPATGLRRPNPQNRPRGGG